MIKPLKKNNRKTLNIYQKEKNPKKLFYTTNKTYIT